MHFLVDNSRDPIRLVVLLSCVICVLGLLWRRFHPPNDDWNPKTKDYWFALLMFAVAGVAATLESLHTNQDYTTRLALTFVASLVCIKGLLAKGRWRGDGFADDEAAEVDAEERRE